MQVTSQDTFDGSLSPESTETLTVETGDRNTSLVLLTVDDGSNGGEPEIYNATWEVDVPESPGPSWRFYKDVPHSTARSWTEPAYAQGLRVKIQNEGPASADYRAKLIAMGGHGSGGGGGILGLPLQDGQQEVSDPSVLLSAVDLNSGVRTTEVRNEFALTPGPLSPFRDWWPALKDTVEGTTTPGTVSYNEDVYVVETDAVADGEAFLETAEVGRYRSGAIAVAGIYVRVPDTPVGAAEWGYGRNENTNELHWRYESDGSLSFVVVRQDVELVIPQSQWATGGPTESRTRTATRRAWSKGLTPWTAPAPRASPLTRRTAMCIG